MGITKEKIEKIFRHVNDDDNIMFFASKGNLFTAVTSGTDAGLADLFGQTFSKFYHQQKSESGKLTLKCLVFQAFFTDEELDRHQEGLSLGDMVDPAKEHEFLHRLWRDLEPRLPDPAATPDPVPARLRNG